MMTGPVSKGRRLIKFLFVVILLVLGGLIVVLPIVAFVRTLRIGALQQRVDQLEREVRELRHMPRAPLVGDTVAAAEPMAEVSV